MRILKEERLSTEKRSVRSFGRRCRRKESTFRKTFSQNADLRFRRNTYCLQSPSNAIFFAYFVCFGTHEAHGTSYVGEGKLFFSQNASVDACAQVGAHSTCPPVEFNGFERIRKRKLFLRRSTLPVLWRCSVQKCVSVCFYGEVDPYAEDKNRHAGKVGSFVGSFLFCKIKKDFTFSCGNSRKSDVHGIAFRFDLDVFQKLHAVCTYTAAVSGEAEESAEILFFGKISFFYRRRQKLLLCRGVSEWT